MSDLHTPGPWEVDLHRKFLCGGDTVSVEAVTGNMVRREVCSCMMDTDGYPSGKGWLEDAANARLIAAAPDLLEACRALLAAAPHDGEGIQRVDACNQARAAIAKAQGVIP